MAKGNPPHHKLSAMKAIQLIPKTPPPQLEEKFSSHIREFVSLCLNDYSDQVNNLKNKQYNDHNVLQFFFKVDKLVPEIFL